MRMQTRTPKDKKQTRLLWVPTRDAVSLDSYKRVKELIENTQPKSRQRYQKQAK